MTFSQLNIENRSKPITYQLLQIEANAYGEQPVAEAPQEESR